MSVQITHVHYADDSSKSHETIDAYKYHHDGESKNWYHWKPAMVSTIEGGERAHTGIFGSFDYAAVTVLNAAPKYLRSQADGYYTNNLLALPTFRPGID